MRHVAARLAPARRRPRNRPAPHPRPRRGGRPPCACRRRAGRPRRTWSARRAERGQERALAVAAAAAAPRGRAARSAAAAAAAAAVAAARLRARLGAHQRAQPLAHLLPAPPSPSGGPSPAHRRARPRPRAAARPEPGRRRPAAPRRRRGVRLHRRFDRPGHAQGGRHAGTPSGEPRQLAGGPGRRPSLCRVALRRGVRAERSCLQTLSRAHLAHPGSTAAAAAAALCAPGLRRTPPACPRERAGQRKGAQIFARRTTTQSSRCSLCITSPFSAMKYPEAAELSGVTCVRTRTITLVERDGGLLGGARFLRSSPDARLLVDLCVC